MRIPDPFRRAAALLRPGAIALAVAATAARAGVNEWTANGPAQVVNTIAAGASGLWAGSADGVYRSENGGRTWTRPADPLAGQTVLSLAVSADGARLYAGTNLGLSVSADAGASWTRAADPGAGIMSLATSAAGVVYAGTFGRGVWASDDGGQTWRRSGELADAIAYALEPAPHDAATIYAGTARGLFVSRDEGRTWRALGEALQGLSVRDVFQSSTDPDHLVVGTYSGVLRSFDAGTSWTAASAGLQPPQVRSLAVDPSNPDVLYAATSTGGFHRTKDGGVSWQAANPGLTELASRFAMLDPADRTRLLGTGAGPGVWEIRFAPEPQIEVAPRSHDFGPVPVGSRVSRTLAIANTGTADLVVADVRLAGSSGFGVDFAGAFAVPAGQSRSVTFTFAPAVRDLILRDQIRISSNDPDEPETAVSVSGRGTRSVLTSSPSRVDFGSVPIPPGFADTAITLTNTGSADLQLFGATFDNGRFSVLSFTPQALRPGRSTTVRVAFSPQVPGPASGNLRLVSDSAPDTLKVPVTGTGTAPDISLSASVLDFGRVDLSGERTLPLTVRNTGTADLTITRLAPRGDQFWVDRTLGVPRDTTFVVPAGDTVRVVAGGDTTLALGGSAATTVQVSRDATRLIADGDTTTVITRGDTTIIVVGRQRTIFAASEDSTVLAPNESFTFQVSYRPTVSGPASDLLEVVSDAPLQRGQTDVVLRGEGNALSLEPMAQIRLGLRPVDLVLAPLDEVAGADMAVVDSATGRLHVLRNDGAGQFPEPDRVSYPTAASGYGPWAAPVAVAAAPIYAAGVNDLVVGDRVARSISLLANDGRGGFAGRRQDLFIGYQLADLVAADLDADGDVDIAVANGPDASAISLLYNDGQAGFSARVVVPVQSGPVALAAGNLNADGHLDLVVANRLSNSVTILLNDRRGGFAVSAHHAVGLGPTDLALTDYDADGDPDIAVATAGFRGVTLLRNRGGGQFEGVTAPQSTNLRPAAVAAAGMTADILNDLVVGGQGDFIVFFENLDGERFTRQDIATGFPVRRVQLADLDGNRVADLVALSADSGRVQVFRNRLVGRQVPPRPPARVAAADRTRDLGGRIELTWEDGDYGTTRPEEQVIATTDYAILRSTAADVADADTLAVVPGGTLAYTDATATPYATFYYQVIARRGDLRSAPSEPASAVSLPAPLVDLKLANAPRLSRGDTLRAQVYLTPAQHRIAGLSVFLTFDPQALRLLPAPSDTTQPFRVSPDLAGTFAAAMNARHDGVRDSGKLDLTLITTAPGSAASLSSGVEPVLLAEVWLEANQQVSTFLSIDDEPAANRRTAVVEEATGTWIEPVLGDTIRLTVRDLFVRGSLQLQRRSGAAVAAEPATVLLIGSLGDTLQSPLNDMDRTTPGIQVPLDETGGFALDQIPRGTYRVFAKVPTHLQGLVAGDTTTVDSLRRQLTFRWVAPDTTAVDSLPAGDANDDNRINLADFGLLVRHFGKSPASSDWTAASRADFDGDEQVGFDDFMLLADNFGRVGMEVVAAARAAGARGRVWVDAGGVLRGLGLGPVRGVCVLLPPGVTARADGSVFADAGDYHLRDWEVPRGRRLALALTAAAAAPGDGALLALEGGADLEPILASVELLDGEGRSFRPGAGAARPTASRLEASYPNPFNPATTIPFDVAAGPAAIAVRLELFDVLGQQVRVLVDEPLAAGRYRADWDGRDADGRPVASGLYLARLSAGTYRATARLLLVR